MKKLLLSLIVIILCSTLVLASNCVDSDGGLDYSVKGTTTSDADSKIDYCSDFRGYNLIEYVCQGGDVVWNGYVCPNGCVDGTCIEKATSLDVQYFLAQEDGQQGYSIYVMPSHESAKHSEVYVTVVLEGQDLVKDLQIVKVISNDPKNRMYKVYEYDSMLNAYNFGRVTDSDLETFNQVTFRLTYADEVKETVVNLNSLKKKHINRFNPKIDEEPVIIPKTESTTNELVYLCNGCISNDVCYPLGYRKEGNYCSDSKEFVSQKLEESACDNNFECSTNLCIDNQCISSGLWQKLMKWLSALFN